MRAQFVARFVLSCGILHAQVGTGITTFHVDPQRTGWWPGETVLTPANVPGGNFGPLWNSPQFDIVNGGTPHAYATPLYLRSVTISAGPYAGGTFDVVYAATSTGFVYAVNAFNATNATSTGTVQVPAGTILWKQSIGFPANNINLDSVSLGVLSTPVIDPTKHPTPIYVTCADATAGWQIFALDVTSGNVLPGWPLAINNGTVSPVNQNGPSAFQSTGAVSQRGALNLSPNGRYLYIPFGGYTDSAAGWLVAVDTTVPAIVSSFSGAPSTAGIANGGMWAASGVAIDPAGNVYSTTGNGSTGNESTPGYWGNSFLAWKPGVPLTLFGTYTPFNYCAMDVGDIDISGGGPMLVPNSGLVTFGGKQGNVYLLSLNNLPGNLSGRQGCGSDASKDTSLLPPGNQPQFGTPGPLNVFGPYSETNNNLNFAKARTTPAFFQGADGTLYVFASGSNKANATSQTDVPPGLCRLKIVTSGQNPYLAMDACEPTESLITPGSPVITSNGGSNAILWELVANIPREQSFNGSSKPFLMAVDPMTMNVLFQSAPGQLNEGGKYNSPLVVDGTVFVATDRIQAFGILPPPLIGATAGTPQSAAVGTPFATPFQATVTNSGGTPVSGATVTFTAPASGASGTFGGSVSATATTNTNGIATAPAFTANATTGPYTVAASAASVPAQASFNLTNTAAVARGSLQGSGTSAATAVNLTAQGSADWVHWGDASLNRKAGVTPQLSNYSVVGNGSVQSYNNDPRALSWTDGTPTASASNNTNGVYINGVGQGFSFTAPADPTSRTAVVHVGGYNSGGTFTAHLSDGSAPDFTDITAAAGGQYDRNYTLTYQAASAGQTLNVSWKMTSGGGNVTMNAVALQGGGGMGSIVASAGTAQSAVVNTAFASALQVTVRDSGGNPVAGALVTFSIPANGASGVFATSAIVSTNSNGVAIAPALTADATAGAYTVTASAAGVTTPASFSLTNTASGPPASIVASAGTPQSAVMNTAFASALQVTVKDSGGNPVAGALVTFSIPANGASGIFAASATVSTNGNGVAIAPALTANAASGGYTVTASVAGVTTPANFSLTNIASGPPASIVASAGTPQSAVMNTAFASALQAAVKDSRGNPVGGALVTFSVPASGASGIFAASATVSTNGSGVAIAPALTANATTGGYTVTASVAGVTTPASFSLTNIASGPPASIVASAGTAQSAVMNTAFASALQVTVKDSGGNPVAGALVTFSIPASGASGVFATSAIVSTNSNGVAIAPALTADATAGAYTITASVAGVTTPASFSLTNTASGGGSLTGAGTNATTAVNLTAEGTTDWEHFGDNSLIRKANVPAQLTTYKVLGSGGVQTYNNDLRAVSWSDGTPTASSSGDRNGVYIGGVGQGFSLTAPADTTLRTLVLHAGGYNSGGMLTAHLSDGSAVDFTDSPAYSGGQYDRNYSLTYQAGSAGQTLNVTWAMASGGGNVTLNGAALH